MLSEGSMGDNLAPSYSSIWQRSGIILPGLKRVEHFSLSKMVLYDLFPTLLE